LALFGSEGFGGTTITEIERQAGLAAGTGSFYRHFKSKDELLHAAVEHEVGRCMAAIADRRTTVDRPSNPRAARAKHLALALQDIRHFDRLFRIAMREGDRVPAVRTVIADAVRAPTEALALSDSPTTSLVIAALTGFHLLDLLFGETSLGMSEAELLIALTDATLAT
jgi:AcrR family transcriptional regulator